MLSLIALISNALLRALKDFLLRGRPLLHELPQGLPWGVLPHALVLPVTLPRVLPAILRDDLDAEDHGAAGLCLPAGRLASLHRQARCYALLGLICFGDVSDRFGDLTETLRTLFAVVNGDVIYDNFNALDYFAGLGGQLYLYIYVLLFTYGIASFLLRCAALLLLFSLADLSQATARRQWLRSRSLTWAAVPRLGPQTRSLPPAPPPSPPCFRDSQARTARRALWARETCQITCAFCFRRWTTASPADLCKAEA
eukprot:scaffold5636_cov159-Ochromonas_danica.AAC.16